MKLIPNSVSRPVARQLLLTRKHSPTIMFVGGIAGVLASTVLACRATLKLEDTLDEFKEDVDAVKKMANEPPMNYDISEHKKDLAHAYFRGTYSVIKLYAPAAAIGAASIGLLTSSHVTLVRRNAALTAAYTGLSAAYDEYRERVRARLGEQEEKDLFNGIEVEKDGKNELRTVDPNKLSMYAKIFDEYNTHWKKNAELNRFFLQAQQNYANHILQARGHIFLNEIYDDLGFERTQAGSVVGWVMTKDGDNYVDFGLFDARNADFINANERSIVLDFNVDGVIYDKI